jgi:hypothetical protein
MNEAQNMMLTRLEMYCSSNHTPAWTGDGSELKEIGGREVLYELEQRGVVTINRIGEKWIISPDRKAGLHIQDVMLEEFVKVTDAHASTSPEEVYPTIINEANTMPSSTDFICKECHVPMEKGEGDVYTCPICSWVDW